MSEAFVEEYRKLINKIEAVVVARALDASEAPPEGLLWTTSLSKDEVMEMYECVASVAEDVASKEDLAPIHSILKTYQKTALKRGSVK